MKAHARLRARLGDAIAVDEIGLESGGYGLYRLRSRYEQVFERRGRFLHLAAVEGVVSPYIAVEEVPTSVFEAAVAVGDASFIDHMSLALAVRNHASLDIDRTPLLVDLPPSGNCGDLVRFVSVEADLAGLDPSLVVCAVREPSKSYRIELNDLAAAVRDSGMHVAIADFGAGRWSDGQMDLVDPNIVKIDAEWFRKICRDPMTIRLFITVVAHLHQRNAKVLVSGIENMQHLGVALEAGADLFTGTHLAPTVPAGGMPVERFSLRDKLGGSGEIVHLRG